MHVKHEVSTANDSLQVVWRVIPCMAWRWMRFMNVQSLVLGNVGDVPDLITACGARLEDCATKLSGEQLDSIP